jgi:uncharacterized RDD family membrane protein YckC
MTAPVDDATAQAVAAPPPGLLRRLAAFAYEGVLLFGVVMLAGYLYGSLTQQRHALQGQTGLQAFLFVILGLYFVAFWSRGGQTVAMRAWHLRLVTLDGRPVSQARALARYMASWIWFVPALLSAHLASLRSAAEIFILMAAGVMAYAMLALLHPRRQFWHDALCGTRLVTWHAKRPRAQSPA